MASHSRRITQSLGETARHSITLRGGHGGDRHAPAAGWPSRRGTTRARGAWLGASRIQRAAVCLGGHRPARRSTAPARRHLRRRPARGGRPGRLVDAAARGFAFGVFPRRCPGREQPACSWVACAALARWTFAGLSCTESDERTSIELLGAVCAPTTPGLLLLAVCVLLARSTAGAAAAGASLALTAGVVRPRSPPACGRRPSRPTRGRLRRRGSTTRSNYWNAVGAWGAISATVALT